jgi:hypothetical protein
MNKRIKPAAIVLSKVVTSTSWSETMISYQEIWRAVHSLGVLVRELVERVSLDSSFINKHPDVVIRSETTLDTSDHISSTASKPQKSEVLLLKSFHIKILPFV